MDGLFNSISIAVISLVMGCALLGAIASVFNSEQGLGKEFLDGLHAIGHIFVPTAGIMAAVPVLSAVVHTVLGPAYSSVGADPAISATTVIAVDMGGYQLAHRLAESTETWIIAMMNGYMAGATIVFSIPVGLAMLEKRDHPYMALGIMTGLLSIPIGVGVSCLILWIVAPAVRPEVSNTAAATHTLALTLPIIFRNLAPLTILMALLALGLHLVPRRMIQGFMAFGHIMDAGIKLILAASIIEYFTAIFYGQGAFTYLFGVWKLDPIIADQHDQLRALEVAGYIGTMLAGAFPMVYLIKKYLSAPMQRFASRMGLESVGAAGILASIANILAMFRLVKEMRPKDKVLNISFAVCAAFLFGDHLAFTANFQPTLMLAVMLGKISGGVAGFLLAHWIAVPKAEQLFEPPVVNSAP